MTFGLSDDQYEILDSLLISPLKNKGYSIWVFGSRARGDHHRFSDIDLLYAAPDNGEDSLLVSKILEDLTNSNLTIKVDLVNNESLAESYRENVLRDRVLL